MFTEHPLDALSGVCVFFGVQHSTLPAQLSRYIGREGACVAVLLQERGGAVVECACVSAALKSLGLRPYFAHVAPLL